MNDSIACNHTDNEILKVILENQEYISKAKDKAEYYRKKNNRNLKYIVLPIVMAGGIFGMIFGGIEISKMTSAGFLAAATASSSVAAAGVIIGAIIFLGLMALVFGACAFFLASDSTQKYKRRQEKNEDIRDGKILSHFGSELGFFALHADNPNSNQHRRFFKKLAKFFPEKLIVSDNEELNITQEDFKKNYLELANGFIFGKKLPEGMKALTTTPLFRLGQTIREKTAPNWHKNCLNCRRLGA